MLKLLKITIQHKTRKAQIYFKMLFTSARAQPLTSKR